MKIGTAINNILFFHSQFFTCTGIYIHKIIWEIQKISELLFLKISLSLYTYIYTLWTHNKTHIYMYIYEKILFKG